MSNMDAIVAGTSNAAKLLGWDKKVGSLTTGKWAGGEPGWTGRALHDAEFVRRRRDRSQYRQRIRRCGSSDEDRDA
jgi:hypothetical protein